MFIYTSRNVIKWWWHKLTFLEHFHNPLSAEPKLGRISWKFSLTLWSASQCVIFLKKIVQLWNESILILNVADIYGSVLQTFFTFLLFVTIFCLSLKRPHLFTKLQYNGYKMPQNIHHKYQSVYTFNSHNQIIYNIVGKSNKLMPCQLLQDTCHLHFDSLVQQFVFWHEH